ncbi:MAG: hypothetical protein AABY22_22235, partial [Nanoarchaeota archaeon]
MDKDFVGKVKSVIGQVVQIECVTENLPPIYEILTASEDPLVRLEVQSYASNTIHCLSLTDVSKIYRNMSIYTTNSSLTIPVGSKTLGRVMNLFGDDQDGKGQITTTIRMPIYDKAPTFNTLKPSAQILETGIKVVDFV